MSKKLAMLICAALLACAASAADDKPAQRSIAPPTRIPDPLTSPAAPAGEAVASATVPRAVRSAVVADAARRFKVAESAVVLVRAEKVTWADGSLGCPQPGLMYTQMLVAGFRIVAKTAEGELLYHTDSRGNAVSCASLADTPGNSMTEKLRNGSVPRTGPPAVPADR
jgi:hypothetical protein